MRLIKLSPKWVSLNSYLSVREKQFLSGRRTSSHSLRISFTKCFFSPVEPRKRDGLVKWPITDEENDLSPKTTIADFCRERKRRKEKAVNRGQGKKKESFFPCFHFFPRRFFERIPRENDEEQNVEGGDSGCAWWSHSGKNPFPFYNDSRERFPMKESMMECKKKKKAKRPLFYSLKASGRLLSYRMKPAILTRMWIVAATFRARASSTHTHEGTFETRARRLVCLVHKTRIALLLFVRPFRRSKIGKRQ